MKKTFKIGGVHPNDNKLSSDIAIENFPPLSKAYISMAQHLGAPATPIVKVGDRIKVGQVIGEPAGFISAFVHSSVSGTVSAIEPVKDLAGNPVMHVIVDIEGDEWCEDIDRSASVKSDITDSAEVILDKIKKCGIVGMGGATFPTNVKLAPPKGKVAEFLILNGAECEPYVTADDRIMREMPEQILIGGLIMMKALGVHKGFIGIEENKREALAIMRKASDKYHDIEVVELKKKYPQGGEKQLIDTVTHRRVPSMGLPIDTGVVVQNVATSLAVYEAVQKNKPCFERIMTVTGGCLKNKKNLRVRIGTRISDIIEYVGGAPSDAAKFISGGPMMGKAIANLDADTLKGSSCLLMMTEAETKRKPEGNCIRCGKCIAACPMGLEPYLLNKLCLMGGQYDELEKNKIFDCIECGCCLSTCPSYIPLLDIIRINKAEVMKIMRSRAQK